MEQAYYDAFSEVYCILSQMSKENVNKISKSFIELIEKNRNKKYNPNLPPNVLNNPELLKEETRIILSIIYREYICSSNEKKELEVKDEEEIKEKYSYDNLFKSKKIEKIKENEILDIENIGKIKRFIIYIKKKIISLIKEK